jgi:oxalate decarboxylase/phosphoglucose isomerase-like protein (cupin superfamily)
MERAYGMRARDGGCGLSGGRHGIFNTGLEDLVFVVVASPPTDMPEVKPDRNRRM